MNGANRKASAWLVGLVCAAVLSGCGGCGDGKQYEASSASDGRADAKQQILTLSEADVTQVRRGRIAAGPHITGSTTLAQKASVRAELGGQVSDVGAQRGESVQSGQLLARIKKDAVDANVESAKVALRSSMQQLKVAQAEFKRTEYLVGQGAYAANRIDVPDNKVSAARAQVSQARARLTTAEETRGDATVRAPINGVVSQRGVDPGDVVSPGNLLFTVVDPHSVQFDATAPAQSADALTVGAPVEFTVRGYPGRQFHGQISRVDPVAQSQTRQIPIIVELPRAAKERGLVAGLFAEGRVVARSRRGLLVSQEGVTKDGAQSSVLVLRDGQIQQVTVKTGLLDQTHGTVEILAGLRAGEYILVGSAARDITAGTPVELSISAGGPETPTKEPQNDAGAVENRPNIGGGPSKDVSTHAD